MIRVVLAEDHHLVRQGLRAVLDKAEEITVVGEAADGPPTGFPTQPLKMKRLGPRSGPLPNNRNRIKWRSSAPIPSG
jgi:hypothetical protein